MIITAARGKLKYYAYIPIYTRFRNIFEHDGHKKKYNKMYSKSSGTISASHCEYK